MLNQHSSQAKIVSEHYSEAIEPDFDIERELEYLADLVLDGVTLPLSKWTIIDQEKILYQLATIRTHLPTALAAAIEILHQRQEIIQEAENYAHNLVKSAQEKAGQILNESAIIRQAELEADQLHYQTQKECEQLQQQTRAQIEHWRELAIAECKDIQSGADDYADAVLSNIEQQLKDMLGVIVKGRQQLQANRVEM